MSAFLLISSAYPPGTDTLDKARLPPGARFEVSLRTFFRPAA